MKIESIELYNIQCYSHAQFALSPLTVISGPNDAGKSTIGVALEACLTGKFTHPHGNGSIKDLLRKGEQVGTITLHLKNGRRVARSTDGALSVNWKPRAGQREAQMELETMMGCTVDRARLPLSGIRFFRLDHKEQKSLLQDLIGLEISPELVRAELDKLNENLALFKTIEQFAPGASLSDFGKIYAKLYEQRTRSKGALDQARKAVAALEQPQEEQVFVSDEDHRQALNDEMELSRQRDELQKQIASWTHWESVRRVHEGRIASLREKVSTLPEVKEDMDQLASRLKGCQERLNALRQEQRTVDELLSRKSMLQQQEMELKATLNGLSQQKCENCNHPLRGVKEIVDGYRRQLEQNQAEFAEVSRLLGQMQDVPTLDRRILAGEARVKELQGEMETAQKAAGLRMAGEYLVAQLEQAEKDLQEAQERLAALSRPEALAKAVEELDRALHEARTTCKLGDAWRVNKVHLDRAKQQVHQLTDEVACLEKLVPFYRPDGFQLEFTRGRMSDFEALLNRYLSPLGLAGRYSEELVFELSRDGGPFVPYTRTADSAFILAGLAHQLAFAEYTGLGIVILDRLEALEEVRRDRLIEYCDELTGPDHIILMGAIPAKTFADHEAWIHRWINVVPEVATV